MTVEKFKGFSNEQLNELKNLHATPRIVEDAPKSKLRELCELSTEELWMILNDAIENKVFDERSRRESIELIKQYKKEYPESAQRACLDESAFDDASFQDLIDEEIAKIRAEIDKRNFIDSELDIIKKRNEN